MAYLQGRYPIAGRSELAKGIYSYRIHCPEIASQAKAGQFVHLRADGFFLRRPISICEIDRQSGELRIVFEAVSYTHLDVYKRQGRRPGTPSS